LKDLDEVWKKALEGCLLEELVKLICWDVIDAIRFGFD
jgi:hypothetical protein